MLKWVAKNPGVDPLKMIGAVETALQAGIAVSLDVISKQVTRDTLRDIRRRATSVTENTRHQFDEINDTSLNNALWEYVQSIHPQVQRTQDWVAVQIGVEDRATRLGWNLPRLLRLLEYGGAALIGGRTFVLSPQPHWRSTAAWVLRNVRRYQEAAAEQVTQFVLERLRAV